MNPLDTFKDRNICILGLGYVGLTLSTAMADAGFRVHGVELRQEVLDLLQKGEPHFHEPGLKEQLQRVMEKKRFTFSQRIPKGIDATVFIITVGTPLKDGRVRVDMIENVAKEISEHMKDGDIVIMRSTVKLGITRELILPILQKSGKKFDLCFCPERTLEGKALRELRELPQIAGGLNFESTIRAGQIFQFLTPTIVRVSDLETAEMIKMIDNAQRDVQFAYANEVARICDAIGVSAIEVIQAGKLGYTRTNLPLPGPVGGPCLEKDPYILAEGLEKYSVVPEITIAGRKLNEATPIRCADFLAKMAQKKGIPSDAKISLLGLAFKGVPATDDLRGTTALHFFKRMKEHFPKAKFVGFDAVVVKKDIESLGLIASSSLKEAMSDAHLVAILNNHPIFPSMPLYELASHMKQPGIIYDFWNNFQIRDLSMPKQITYVALGSHGKAVEG